MLYIELAIIVALILLNGLLALAELAIVSSRRARLRALVDRDVVGSRRALALATNPGRFLSTVQIGITLVGVLSGAFSGATFGLRLTEWFVALGLRASGTVVELIRCSTSPAAALSQASVPERPVALPPEKGSAPCQTLPHHFSIASCRTVSVGTGKSSTPRTASSSEALRTSEGARAPLRLTPHSIY
jgi:Mg2+/Co2+ transporter CorB